MFKPFRAQVNLDNKQHHNCIILKLYEDGDILCVVDDKSSNFYGDIKVKRLDSFKLTDQQIQQLESRLAS